MGTAPNLKHYAKDVDRIIGVDPNMAMHQYARKAAEAAGAAAKLQLVTGTAEALPLEDASADAVVMTHVCALAASSWHQGCSARLLCNDQAAFRAGFSRQQLPMPRAAAQHAPAPPQPRRCCAACATSSRR